MITFTISLLNYCLISKLSNKLVLNPSLFQNLTLPVPISDEEGDEPKFLFSNFFVVLQKVLEALVQNGLTKSH